MNINRLQMKGLSVTFSCYNLRHLINQIVWNKFNIQAFLFARPSDWRTFFLPTVHVNRINICQLNLSFLFYMIYFICIEFKAQLQILCTIQLPVFSCNITILVISLIKLSKLRRWNLNPCPLNCESGHTFTLLLYDVNIRSASVIGTDKLRGLITP